MLPIVPGGPDRSPYNSPSAFAGSSLLISLENLVRDGLLKKKDIRSVKAFKSDRVNYSAVARFKEVRLKKAFQGFGASIDRKGQENFESFCTAEDEWLSDFALFSALKAIFHGKPWVQWTKELRSRNPGALDEARKKLKGEVQYHKFVQYLFSLQWMEFREYCRKKRVGLIGDIPIYVSLDSADVWAHQDLFRLDSEGRPTVVAGVPPDYFSKTGQLWGNPLYRWDVLRRRKYNWWVKRIRSRIEKFDALRLDHFIGFHRYWEVSGRARTAKNGRWARGPGADFFEQVIRQIGPVEFIAEDLGSLTPGVISLRDKFGFPGMRVLQFEFGSKSEVALGHSFTIPGRCVLYTGTHDNDTVIGWLNEKSGSGSQRSETVIRKEREIALRISGSDGREFHRDMIRFAFASQANLAIIPLQDVLGLGSQARMNKPGTERGNWTWRLRKGQLKGRHADYLLELAKMYERLPHS